MSESPKKICKVPPLFSGTKKDPNVWRSPMEPFYETNSGVLGRRINSAYLRLMAVNSSESALIAVNSEESQEIGKNGDPNDTLTATKRGHWPA